MKKQIKSEPLEEQKRQLRNRDLALIDFVRDNPLLYDLSHHKYKDPKEKGRTWEKILDYPGGKAAAQRRFAALRSRFVEEKRKYVPSGSDIQEEQQWEYFNEMQFLTPFTEDPMRESSFPAEEVIDVVDEDAELYANLVNSPSAVPKRRKISGNAERELSDERFLSGLGEIVTSALGSSSKESEEQQFGRFVGTTLSKLYNEDVKDEAILAIQQVLQKAKKKVRKNVSSNFDEYKF